MFNSVHNSWNIENFKSARFEMLSRVYLFNAVVGQEILKFLFESPITTG